MSGISSLFGIGASALFAYQKALATTGHNLANVHTEGYSRQDIVLAETTPANGRPGQVGTGVEAAAIRRSFDAFIGRQMLSSREKMGRFDAARHALADVEGLFGDSNDLGLGAGLIDLFDAMQDVATDPTDLAARSVLLSRATTLAARFNQASRDLTDQRVGLDQQISQAIADVNALSSQVADLNDKIATVERGGQQANDLRDQRERVLGSLAELIDISTIEDASGQVNVFVGKGQVLVSENAARELTGVAVAGNSGLLDVRYDDGTGTPVSIASAITSGRLKGYLDIRDTSIPALLTRLDTLAGTLVSQVNTQHRLGYGLDGSTGLDFFTVTGTTAGTIAVSLTDRRQIAASGTSGGVPGNNTNALALAALQHATPAVLGTTTFNAYYATLAADAGSEAQAAAHDFEAQEILHGQLESHRAERSGVSMDEELANMLKYQRAFEAASRVIMMADEVLQTILAMKR